MCSLHQLEAVWNDAHPHPGQIGGMKLGHGWRLRHDGGAEMLDLRRALLCLFLLVTSVHAWASAPPIVRVNSAAETNKSSGKCSGSTSAKVADSYVGSQVCANCHSDIYRSYIKTSMGRSMSEIRAKTLQELHLPATFYDSKLNRHYDVYSSDEKLFESEYETDPAGNDIFRETLPVRWTIGAGENGIGGVVQRGNYLFEAPLALYTKPMTWALAPGYEFADYSFSRPILAGCIFCHSGRANPVANTNGGYQAVPFSEVAIGCENCHGPGAKHVEAMVHDGGVDKTARAIVNPARLTPELANNICMACHELGDARILQPGKTYGDIRPGTPLDHVLSILMVPPTYESPPQPDHLQQYYSMTLSKCYRASGARLRCITCHDPHVEPSEREAPAFYNKRCLTCHTDKTCRLSPIKRQRTSPPDNCVGCHMPKRDVKFIAHASLTNHRILAQPDQPLPAVAFQQTTASLPDLIHLDPAPGKKDVPPSSLVLLQAYGELAADNANYADRYLSTLDGLKKSDQNSALVQAALGRRDLLSGKFPEAVDHLQRALHFGAPLASEYADLSTALEKLDRTDEALSAQQSAVEQDPYNPVLQKRLVLLLINQKRYTEARAGIVHYLEMFPQDSFMRKMLALSGGKFPQK